MAFDFDALNRDTMAIFGDPVGYDPVAGAAYTVPDAVFDAAYTMTLVDPASGEPVSWTGPAVGVRRASLQADPRQDDRVTVGLVPYLVRDVHPDGKGWILLRLSQTA